MKTVSLTVLNDSQIEDDEDIYVYILPQTVGVRVALPSQDNGNKVGSVFLILPISAKNIFFKLILT